MAQYGHNYNQQYAQQYAANPSAAAYGYGAYGYGQPAYPAAYGYGQPAAQPTASPQANALWMGDIEPWMDEAYIANLFASNGDLSYAKVIKDKVTHQPAGYGFLYFNSQAGALRALEAFNGQPFADTGKKFRLNWAAHGMGKNVTQGGGNPAASAYRGPSAAPMAHAMQPVQHMQPMQPLPRPNPGAENLAVFVGDLSPDVTDYYLLSTFQYYYPSAYTAKVVKDQTTLLPKGYGFVYFSDEVEKNRSLTEMQGYPISFRPIKINPATKKKDPSAYVSSYPPTNAYASSYPPSGYPSYPPSANYPQQPAEASNSPTPVFPPAQPSHPTPFSQQISQASQQQSSQTSQSPQAAQATQGYQASQTSQSSQSYPSAQASQGYQGSQSSQYQGYPPSQGSQGGFPPTDRIQGPDPLNTTVFVGGIDGTISHESLKNFLAPYGEITNVKIPMGKGCGFVEFQTHEMAAKALEALGDRPNVIGHCAVRLSWGRPAVKVGASGEAELAKPPMKAVPPTIPNFGEFSGNAQYDPESDSGQVEEGKVELPKEEVPESPKSPQVEKQVEEAQVEKEEKIEDSSSSSSSEEDTRRRPQVEDEKPAKKAKQVPKKVPKKSPTKGKKSKKVSESESSSDSDSDSD